MCSGQDFGSSCEGCEPVEELLATSYEKVREILTTSLR